MQMSVAFILGERGYELLQFLEAFVVSFLLICWSSTWLGKCQKWKDPEEDEEDEDISSSCEDDHEEADECNDKCEREPSNASMFTANNSHRLDVISTAATSTMRRSTSLPSRLDAALVYQHATSHCASRTRRPDRHCLRTWSLNVPHHHHYSWSHGTSSSAAAAPSAAGSVRNPSSRIVMDLLYAASNMQRQRQRQPPVLHHPHNIDDNDDDDDQVMFPLDTDDSSNSSLNTNNAAARQRVPLPPPPPAAAAAPLPHWGQEQPRPGARGLVMVPPAAAALAGAAGAARGRAARRRRHDRWGDAPGRVQMLVAREHDLLLLPSTTNNTANTRQAQPTTTTTTTTTTTMALTNNNNTIIPLECPFQHMLKPLHNNDPTCTVFTERIRTDPDAACLAEALQHNTTLQCLHLYPSEWRDLGIVKSIAKSIQNHPTLVQVHLHPNHPCHHHHPFPFGGGGGCGCNNFVSQLSLDILIQAMCRNSAICHWGLHLATSSSCFKKPLSSSSASSSAAAAWLLQDKAITDTLCRCIASCNHLDTLQLVDEHEWSSSCSSVSQSPANVRGVVPLPTTTTTTTTMTEPQQKLATAIAQASSLTTLLLHKMDHVYLEHLFREFANNNNNNNNASLQTLHIESSRHAGTAGLEVYLAMPSCQLRTLRFQNIQSFQRLHMDQLVQGLLANTSVQDISFVDCGFHPEVVRPLQDLVRTRLDLKFFQITRCNADPTMAILTCFQNNHSQVQSITMGYSLGIEDRLGGDAIRSVLRYNSTLVSLNLMGSHRLGQVGLRHLARGLGKNATLQKLDLSHCSIPHASLALMIQHITGNPATKLSSINLSHNSLNQTGVRLLVDDWLLHPDCRLQELILNRCEIVAEAFMTLIRAIANHTTPLQVLEMQECGRLSVHGLQEFAESLFRLGKLRVFKASCFKSSVHPIRPVPAHAAAPLPGNHAVENELFFPVDDIIDSDEEDDDSDMEDDPILLAAIVEEVANRRIHAAANQEHFNRDHDPAMTGSLRLLRETFLAGLIHNQRLEHISFVNLLECVMKTKDAARVRAWMDFCGRRNQLQPLLQQTDLPLLKIMTDVVRECRDPRTGTLNATGLSLYYHCLRNRPDALDRVRRMLTVQTHEKSSARLSQ